MNLGLHYMLESQGTHIRRGWPLPNADMEAYCSFAVSLQAMPSWCTRYTTVYIVQRTIHTVARVDPISLLRMEIGSGAGNRQSDALLHTKINCSRTFHNDRVIPPSGLLRGKEAASLPWSCQAYCRNAVSVSNSLSPSHKHHWPNKTYIRRNPSDLSGWRNFLHLPIPLGHGPRLICNMQDPVQAVRFLGTIEAER